MTALLLVSLWLVLDKMSQLSALDNLEMELYEKRLRTNEAFTDDGANHRLYENF